MPYQLPAHAREANNATLARLKDVMNRNNLKYSEVGYLTGYRRKTVYKWFHNERLCPDRIPETLDAICSIRTRESIEAEIREKRRGAK